MGPQRVVNRKKTHGAKDSLASHRTGPFAGLHLTAQNRMQLKNYELFISEIFYLIFLKINEHR